MNMVCEHYKTCNMHCSYIHDGPYDFEVDKNHNMASCIFYGEKEFMFMKFHKRIPCTPFQWKMYKASLKEK